MKFLSGLLTGLLFWLAIGAAQSVVNDPDPSKEPPAYLPSDLGQKSCLWLQQNGDGVLILMWEKHEQVGYGMMPRQIEYGAKSVPVSVD